MDALELRPISRPVDRTIRLPGSKSLTNRALLAAALASGRSRLSGVLFSDDTDRMMAALRAVGVSMRLEPAGARAAINGAGGGWSAEEVDLSCGNAGTVVRFMTAACCLGTGRYRLDGVPRMRERPIGDLVAALLELGARITFEDREGYCPLVVDAVGLGGGTIGLASPRSSQFVSALLQAAPLASSDVMIDVTGAMPSAPYVRMTLEVMKAFGVSAVEDELQRFIVPGQQSYHATDYEIEPDASAASYFFAAAALTGGRVTVDGLGERSVQGDTRFVDVLADMGCEVDRAAQATTVRGPRDGRLRGVDVDLNDMPDVAMTLAVLAAFAEGPTRIRNVANLRIKETDRLHALATELGRMGVETEVGMDAITVRPGRPPVGAAIETYDDHRIAMSFALAGLRTEGVVIRDPGCVSKTFPAFFDVWRELGD